MYKPDRAIVKKVREYDPDLYIKWNDNGYFELRRKALFKADQLITPITREVYGLPRLESGERFVPLDDRIITWIYYADSHKHGGAQKHVRGAENSYLEETRRTFRKAKEEFRDRAKDAYNLLNNKYVTPTYTKKTRPTFSNWKDKVDAKPMIKPDVRSKTSKRIFKRSKANALAYNYQRKK